MKLRWMLLAASGLTALPMTPACGQAYGSDGSAGCRDARPTVHKRLVIDKPGIYENLLIDGRWVEGTLLKIRADNVVLRNCEIRNGKHNGILVTGRKVVIESCRIHHLLKGTFKDQQDAHGITGTPRDLIIRNCEIFQVSGDAVQFDPDRRAWDGVLVERCTMWTGPLKQDSAGFRKGERPGENALDTKILAKDPRARIALHHCHFYGWNQPGQISLMAALNIKENVLVEVVGCVFDDNQVSLRLRGNTGPRGGANVSVRDCRIYRSGVAVRMEDGIEKLMILRLGIGEGVKRTYQHAGGGAGKDFVNTGEYPAKPL